MIATIESYTILRAVRAIFPLADQITAQMWLNGIQGA